MGWLDVLLGRTRPVPSQAEKLFAISTAQVTLAAKLDARPSGRAGICFKPVSASAFQTAAEELKGLLEITARETGSRINFARDSFGYQWVVIADPQFEDLVATLHLVSQTLTEQGFGDQLLAALFQFQDSEGQIIYWVYSYKRGNFYPFVPTGDRQRDNARELRLRAVMENEMPIEPDLERWYPLWDAPLTS